jgi:hypothetical protein
MNEGLPIIAFKQRYNGGCMPILEKLARRYKELEQELGAIKWIGSEDYVSAYASGDAWRQWASSAMHLIQITFGEDSAHYKNFKSAYNACAGYQHQFSDLKGIFLGASADYRGGYLFHIETTISGELLGDFVSMARLALAEGYKDVAAVLACAALEDTLKRYACLNELNVDDKALQEVVSALKSKGLVSGAQKSLLDVMPKIRDFAMHANWDKIQSADVQSVIGFVEQFLLTKFE